MASSLKELLSKADGPADIAAIVLGASVGGTVDLIAMAHGVPTLGGAALLGAGYVFGARQSVKAYFSLRSRRHSTQNQHKIEALERERIRLQADVLLDFVQSETRADSLGEELVGDIQKEIKLFDRKLTTESDLVEAVARLTDRARQLPLRNKQTEKRQKQLQGRKTLFGRGGRRKVLQQKKYLPHQSWSRQPSIRRMMPNHRGTTSAKTSAARISGPVLVTTSTRTG